MPETKQKKTPRVPSQEPDPHKGNPNRTRPDLEPVEMSEALKAVRKIRAENEARVMSHSRTEVQFGVAALGEDVEPIEITTADSRLFIDTHGEKVLDQDGIADLQRKLAAAFQAVS